MAEPRAGAWGDSSGIVCLSVRSAFELLLETLQLAPGDEIVFTAITHPDMVRIAEARGLVPIPLDLDPATLAPDAETLERVITPRSRLLVVAHLFGGRVDLAPLVSVARRHQLLVVEDCAQCFTGPHDRGDEFADASLFSFGSIKTATALGGALVRVADRRLAGRMQKKSGVRPTGPEVRRPPGARPTTYLLVVRAATECDGSGSRQRRERRGPGLPGP